MISENNEGASQIAYELYVAFLLITKIINTFMDEKKNYTFLWYQKCVIHLYFQ